MKKTVQIVTIPLDKEGWGNNALLKRQPPQIDQYIIADKGSNPITESIWQAQQLLVLSDDKIQLNDMYYASGSRTLEYSVFKADTERLVKIGNELSVKKVIASYPQIEGTLSISKKTIQEWIDAGTPGEGSVEIDDTIYCSVVKGKVKYGDPTKLDPQGNLLLEFGKKVCSKKEILKKLRYAETPELKDSFLQELHDIREKQSKPSILTNEEIEKKAEQSATEWLKASYNPDIHDEEKENWAKQDYCCGYEDGYKQALKDLGYADN
jgi:hypothetical protein